ncbi:pyruvate carboxyltransferase [Candidatus Microgenomates bacterium]|nr:MAG: pyruvate carboxyltransferase [Candidatus Microgenomates bacterium]
MNNVHAFKGVIDTTLRDGQQSPLMFDSYKYRFSLEEKKTLVNALIALGVRHFEFFAPSVSDIEQQDFNILKEYIREIEPEKIMLLAHVRCNLNDIEQAIRAGFDGLHVYIGLSKNAQKYSHGKSRKQILKMIKDCFAAIRKAHPNLYLRFSAEDSFRTPLMDILYMYDAVVPFVNTFGMPDTVGVATPDQVAQRVQEIRKHYPDTDIECHFHNDRGFSLINALTAVLNGANYIDTSIWGLAERSGITSVTGLLLNLYCQNEKYCKNYNLNLCYPTNVLLGSILKLHVPASEPVSLTNRTHTAGVHQKAVINHRSVYEAIDLEKFGVSSNQLLLGPLSGWNLIYYYLREVAYYDVTVEQAKEITQLFKNKTKGMNKRRKPEEVLNALVLPFNFPKILVKESLLVNRIENLN